MKWQREKLKVPPATLYPVSVYCVCMCVCAAFKVRQQIEHKLLQGSN